MPSGLGDWAGILTMLVGQQKCWGLLNIFIIDH